MITTVEPIHRLTLAEVGRRDFEVIEPGVCYRLRVPGADVVLEVDRLAWRYQELSGELLVRCDLKGTDAIDGVLSVATFNVSSARARAERAGQLKRQSRASAVPWEALLEELCQRVLTAERCGEPAVALADVPVDTDTNPLIDVFGFKLPRRHPSIIFGDGGATKSLLALYLAGCLAKDGYRVAFFDWELDAADHRERYATLFGNAMPATVYYTRCSRPLRNEAERLKRVVREQGIDFAIYDSIGFACEGKPEDAVAALGYMNAARAIGVGSLHIAHVNKSETGDRQPFGSAFWHNSARATWFLKATDQTDSHTVGVFNRKHNVAKWLQAPFGYEVQVDGDRTAFRLVDIAAASPELASKVPLAQRLKSVLKSGALTREAIAAEWPDERPETLRRTINREIEKGRLVRFPGPGGVEQIGLAARRAS
ncbi:MAG TPA: AAA family ATPase [Vicinamibacterales bacterium]|nr:AAA family ATPase [Vicinamibacterales bacterium]